MSHPQQRQFCLNVKEKYKKYFSKCLVVDIGSLDINGNNRGLFEDCLYLGVDVAPGKNVDFVCKGHELSLPNESVDVVVSTECFEHDRFYKKTLLNIFRILKPGGLLFFSCATTGRPEHGTKRTTPEDAPLLSKYGNWSNYYKNLTEEDIRAVLDLDQGFSEYDFSVDESSFDLYFCGIKNGGYVKRFDYSISPYHVFSQLYYDSGEGFSEQNSDIRFACDALSDGAYDESIRFDFDISKRSDLAAVRFDPINSAGVVDVRRVWIESEEGDCDLFEIIQSNAIFRDEGRFFFVTDDAQFLFVLGGLDTNGAPLRFCVEMVIERVGGDAKLFCEQLQNRICINELNDSLETAKNNLIGCQDKLNLATSESQSYKELFNKSKEDFDAVKNELNYALVKNDAIREVLTSTQQNLSVIEAERGQFLVEREAVRKALELSQQNLSLTRIELSHALVERDAVQTALTTIQTDISATKQELNQTVLERNIAQEALRDTRLNLLDTRDQLSRTGAELAEVRKAFNKGQLELSEIQNVLREALVERDSVRGSLEEMQQNLSLVRSELVRVYSERDGVSKMLREVKETLSIKLNVLDKLQKELVLSQDELTKVQQALLETQNSAARTNDELQTVKRYNTTLVAKINEQNVLLDRMRKSLAWRATAPLRTAKGWLHRNLLGYTDVDLVPVHQVSRQPGGGASNWHSDGADPQFILKPRNPGVIKEGGWFMLRYGFISDKPANVQVFVDCGFGFESELAINAVSKTDFVEIPIFLPVSLKSLRLDPVAEVVDFQINNVRIKRVDGTPDIDEVNHGVMRYLCAVDHIGCVLRPVSQLLRDENDISLWHAQGEDPHFSLELHDSSVLHAGWRKIDLLMQTSKKQGVAKFYLDTGVGFNENEVITLPFNSGMRAERVVFFNKPVLAIRFDPKDSEGQFRIERLTIEVLDPDTARLIMLQRLVEQDSSIKIKSSAALINEIKSQGISEDGINAHIIKKYGELYIHRPGSVAYEEWIDQVEKKRLPSRGALLLRLTEMPFRPLISIVMPVYNAPENHLRACIESVIAQSYPNWELCVADDASPKKYIQRVLREYEQNDSRIRVVYREKNGHISRASNSALEIARGEYVALLDHDDALPEHALYFIAEAINEHPRAQILYSDEDKIDELGKRFEPHFKSDWNPDLFFSQNYVSHLGVYQRSILQKIGGFRPGVEGSQDQDLLLRCLPHVQSANIIHIPRVLYHWRTVEGSTALASGEKSYTTDAGIKALQDYFEENHPTSVQIEAGMIPNTYRVRWPIPMQPPLVTLLIPTRDKKEITEIAVRSILEKTTYPNYEIIILDNGSVEPETLRFFEEIQKENKLVKVLSYNHPFNYSAINNFGVAKTSGEIVGLVNNDIEVISPEWLTEMVSHACRPEIGCVGAKLYYGNDTLQHGGVILGIGGVANHAHKNFKRDDPGYFARLTVYQNYSAVTAACLVVRREIYDEVGGLDEENLKVAFNDVDFCLKVREAGYRNLWTPYAELYHHESISRGNEDTPEKMERFQKEVNFMVKKWGRVLEVDPYYNPNLTKVRENFSIGGAEG